MPGAQPYEPEPDPFPHVTTTDLERAKKHVMKTEGVTEHPQPPTEEKPLDADTRSVLLGLSWVVAPAIIFSATDYFDLGAMVGLIVWIGLILGVWNYRR